MKPLTIKELGVLKAGDWAWIILLDKFKARTVDYEFESPHSGKYYQLVVCNETEVVCVVQGADYALALEYSDYGTRWIAYKNKEQAERHPIEIPGVGTPIYYLTENMRGQLVIAKGKISMVTQKSDGTWQFRLSYKIECSRNPHNPNAIWYWDTQQTRCTLADFGKTVFLEALDAERELTLNYRQTTEVYK